LKSTTLLVGHFGFDFACGRRWIRRPILLVSLVLAGILAPTSATQAQTANVLGLPAQVVKGAGKLMICGGGPMSEGFRHEFIRMADGPKAKIVIIPTGMPFPNRQEMENRFASWREMPIESLSFIDTDSRDEANKDDFVKPLECATGVWISGGEQGRLADVYVGTKVEQALTRVLERGGVVGGTSAGAAVMSKMMIRYGSPKAVVGAGFNLLARAVVDQHFLRRNRQERLLGVLSEHPDLVGLGIDEGAALVVQGDHLRVMGDSQVVIYKEVSGSTTPWTETLKPGEEFDLVAGNTTPEATAVATEPATPPGKISDVLPVLAHRTQGQ
jgi:cyanophycinase